ncbi:ethanolamine ammonia-lyase subunit EutC [Spirosoma fluminis]
MIRPQTQWLHSQAIDRQTYLQRPDLGRRLDDSSRLFLQAIRFFEHSPVYTVSIVVADGLSASAINQHAVSAVTKLVRQIGQLGWTLAPICLVQQGRVAIGDEIAHALGAELVVVLIGERPGLSSPDSLGAYLTYQPRPGLTDESRNCVSNIRPDGLPGDLAVDKLIYLLTEMKTRRLSGVDLKDEMPTHTLPSTSSPATSAQTPETLD